MIKRLLIILGIVIGVVGCNTSQPRNPKTQEEMAALLLSDHYRNMGMIDSSNYWKRYADSVRIKMFLDSLSKMKREITPATGK